MAISEIYVDPSIAGDSGAGTVGDPYGDLEYAIEQSTFDTTNGTRVNIKAGTAEIPAASLSTAMADTSVSIAWVPVPGAPLVFQGYTTAAGDLGIGVIDGGGGAGSPQLSSYNYVHFVDMKVFNCGTAAAVVRLGTRSSIIRCDISDCAGRGILATTGFMCIDSNIYAAGTNAIEFTSGYIARNYVSNTGARTMVIAIVPGSANSFIERNIISIDGASDGIGVHYDTVVANNSIYSAGGTGQGITTRATTVVPKAITNNLIEGFSGAGGKGIDLSGASVAGALSHIGGNAVYDCATAYDLTIVDGIISNIGDNETLTASPFTDASSADFSPVDTGNVKEGSIPATIANGAV